MKRFWAYVIAAFLSLCWLGSALAQYVTPVQMRDANLTTTNTQNFISTLNTFTAPRVLTIPDRSSLNAYFIQFVDTANAINGANTLTIQAQSGQINGAASIVVSITGAYIFIAPSSSGYAATVVATASGTPPGGTPGQIQYNNAGAFGGFTTSGDAGINTATGALTLTTVLGTPGTFGSATTCITTTQNLKGLTTAISAATCTPAIGSITGLGTGVATALGFGANSANGLVTQPVANTSLATMAASSVKGNTSASTATPTDIACASNAVVGMNGATLGCQLILNANIFSSAGIVLSKLANGTANSIVGATAAAAHTDLTVPSCSAASSVLQWLSGTGLQCASFASTNLSDTTAATTYTPTDASGAALVFTGTSGNFSKSNRTCIGSFRVTFPSTANASLANISLPCTAANNGNQSMGSCWTTAASPNAILVPLGVANTASVQFVNTAGSIGQPSNANLSTSTLSCAFSFITN